MTGSVDCSLGWGQMSSDKILVGGEATANPRQGEAHIKGWESIFLKKGVKKKC